MSEIYKMFSFEFSIIVSNFSVLFFSCNIVISESNGITKTKDPVYNTAPTQNEIKKNFLISVAFSLSLYKMYMPKQHNMLIAEEGTIR